MVKGYQLGFIGILFIDSTKMVHIVSVGTGFGIKYMTVTKIYLAILHPSV